MNNRTYEKLDLISEIHLDTSRATLHDGVRNSSPWRVDHRHEPNKPKSFQREVRIVRVELESARELIGVESEVTEAEHPLPAPAKILQNITAKS